jgi:hypothetical protein
MVVVAFLSGKCCWPRHRDHDVYRYFRKLARIAVEALILFGGICVQQFHVATVDITKIRKALLKGDKVRGLLLSIIGVPENTDFRYFADLLRTCCEHAVAAPPRSMMSSRRFMSHIALPSQSGAPPSRSFSGALNLPWRGRQVVGADLNSSESSLGAANGLTASNRKAASAEWVERR